MCCRPVSFSFHFPYFFLFAFNHHNQPGGSSSLHYSSGNVYLRVATTVSCRTAAQQNSARASSLTQRQVKIKHTFSPITTRRGELFFFSRGSVLYRTRSHGQTRIQILQQHGFGRGNVRMKCVHRQWSNRISLPVAHVSTQSKQQQQQKAKGTIMEMEKENFT